MNELRHHRASAHADRRRDRPAAAQHDSPLDAPGRTPESLPRWLPALLAGIVLVCATGAQTEPSDLTATSRTSSRLPSLEPVAQWGCEACTGPELFGAVQDVTVSEGGTVYVLDAFEPVVRRFSIGADAVSFGRKGQGPGEFVGGTSIALVDDDVIEIIDRRLRRMMRLDVDGSELSTRPLTDFPISSDYARDMGAWYLGIIDFRTFTSTIELLPDDTEELTPVHTVDWPVDEEGKPTEFFSLVARPGGGFAIGDGHLEYRIRLYDRRGTSVAQIHRAIERVAKSDEELRAERQRRDAGAARRARMAAAEGGSSASLTPPEIDPLERHFYMNALRYDDLGRLWVLTGRGGVADTVFDVFDAANDYLGEIDLPAHVTRYDIAGEWLLTTGMSERDHPVVDLWRMTATRQ